MRSRTQVVVSLAALALVPLALTGTAGAVHFGNNKAELAGSGLEADASGKAVVNFVDGGSDDENPDLFNGAAVIYDLMPGVVYNLVVRGGGMETEICDGLANAQGTFRCSGQMVAVNHGFRTVAVESDSGMEVALGSFDASANGQRGNCRFPAQAGTECERDGR